MPLALALLLAAASGEPAVADVSQRSVPQLLVLELETVEVSEERARLIGGRIADTLAEQAGFETLTADDLRQIVDLAAEKELAGCDQNACLIEVANAMGARYVVFGRVGAFDDSGAMLLQLSLFDADQAKPIAREEVQAEDLRGLLDATPLLARKLVSPLTGEDVRERALVFSPWLWGGLGVSAIGAGAGIGLGVWAVVLNAQLRNVGGEVPRRQKDFARDNLPFVITGAAVGGGVAVLGAIAALTAVVVE
jgi:hypothetical protein